jgi:hypothetical protein
MQFFPHLGRDLSWPFFSLGRSPAGLVRGASQIAAALAHLTCSGPALAVENGQPTPAWTMADFAPPPVIDQVVTDLSGRLTIHFNARDSEITVLTDLHGYAEGDTRLFRQLPAFSFHYVQDGPELIPVRAGAIPTQHPHWEYILEPGRLWSKAGTSPGAEVSLPFTLKEKNADCSHYGVVRFRLDNGRVQKLRYQVSSETCQYFKFNLWGTAAAEFEPGPAPRGDGIIARRRQEKADRLPTRSLQALAADYSSVDTSQFAHPDELRREHVTSFGVVIDRVHYTSSCPTRHGDYPFCADLVLPSYSVAKSMLAGLGLMYLERQYPGFSAGLVSDMVPECADLPSWQDVNLRQLLNMSSGNFHSPLYMRDEDAPQKAAFFFAQDHVGKIGFACHNYPRTGSPGYQWVYHSSDSYLLGRAMQLGLAERLGDEADLWGWLVAQLWRPLIHE